MYKFIVKNKPRKVFKKLSNKEKKQIIKKFENLVQNPFRVANIKSIKERRNAFRLRVGRWRILYYLDSQTETIEVIEIFMKKGREYARIFRVLFELL